MIKSSEIINSSQSIKYAKEGFDGNKYIKLQSEKILERILKFNGKLYLEIGGKFMFDAHASRVLPGFKPESKKIIFESFKNQADILFCVNSDDIINNRQITNENINYNKHIKESINDIEKNIGIKPKIVINKIDLNLDLTKIEKFQKEFVTFGYEVFKRYKIEGYPKNVTKILSKDGYGKDEYIKTSKNLILVTGIASNSGKMSTCLGQLYLDNINGVNSGYAKYETFPVWNLDINHPINLAYEAATADIGDYNIYDEKHKENYGIKSVNYNRDVEAFNIIKLFTDKFISKENYIYNYKSPTDMGISNAGFCIIDDKVCSIASLEEIKRRKIWYQEMVNRGEGKELWVRKCENLEKKCNNYIKHFQF
nr:DUF1846 family protein [Candidatus Gracilibacteria bacterium]